MCTSLCKLNTETDGCGPFGNKAIWEQSHLGTIGGPFGYNGGPFGYNGGPFGYNGGPFGYN